jgi:hypothetical protein
MTNPIETHSRGWQFFARATAGTTAKDEMQGSLHCAMDGGAIHRFGRDDVSRFYANDVTGDAQADAQQQADALIPFRRALAASREEITSPA